jgi:redox-sensing transcriptional repressor
MAGEQDKPPEPSPDGQVPKAVVSRLSLYLRELQRLLRDGHETISSTQLGKMLGFTDAQVRKDLAYFGQFGYPGIGYRCPELVDKIKEILGTNHPWPLAIVGLGNLGRALLGYRGFTHQGFRVAAAFDVDEHKVGRQFDGIPVYHLDQVGQIIPSFRFGWRSSPSRPRLPRRSPMPSSVPAWTAFSTLPRSRSPFPGTCSWRRSIWRSSWSSFPSRW